VFVVAATVFLHLGLAVVRTAVVRPSIERRVPIGAYFADYVMLIVAALVAGAGMVGYGVYSWLP